MSTDKKKKKKIRGGGGGGGVTFDILCSFSNSDELFQSKVMCENLVWIGSNQRYVKFQGRVTCDR